MCAIKCRCDTVPRSNPMSDASRTEQARLWYAEDLRIAAPVVRNPGIVEAFARVPREEFVGTGPWRVLTRAGAGRTHPTPSADPRHVYHDLPIALDADRNLNNGQPSLWAHIFDQLDIAGGETVLQVGAGTGYYTAILAELVGTEGRIIAYEVDTALARRAVAGLASRPRVEVRPGDATRATDLPQIDVVVVCAGVTHVPERWLDRLAEGGRMMLPFTGRHGGGLLLHLRRDGERLPVRSLGPCAFYPCTGARRAEEEEALTAALGKARRNLPELGEYHRGPPPQDAGKVLYACDSYWISTV